jgi:hypothetical protein
MAVMEKIYYATARDYQNRSYPFTGSAATIGRGVAELLEHLGPETPHGISPLTVEQFIPHLVNGYA